MTGKKEIVLGGFENAEAEPEAAPKTSSEIEADLLGRIESHIRAYAFQNRYSPKRINAEVYAYFEQPRREMTVADLERCLSYIQTAYPMSHIRGTGHRRAPTKASPFSVQWRQP